MQFHKRRVVTGRVTGDELLMVLLSYAQSAAPMWRHHSHRLRKSKRLQAIAFHNLAGVSKYGQDKRIFSSEDERKFLAMRTASLPYNRKLREMEEDYIEGAPPARSCTRVPRSDATPRLHPSVGEAEHEAWKKAAADLAGGSWGVYDALKRQGCACTGEERAREIGDEIWHERLAEAWPDRRDVDLDPADDTSPGSGAPLVYATSYADGRVEEMESLEANVHPDAVDGVSQIGPTANRAAVNGGYRPECPDEPVEGLPAACPSPDALARLSRELGAAMGSAMMNDEVRCLEGGDAHPACAKAWGRWEPRIIAHDREGRSRLTDRGAKASGHVGGAKWGPPQTTQHFEW